MTNNKNPIMYLKIHHPTAKLFSSLFNQLNNNFNYQTPRPNFRFVSFEGCYNEMESPTPRSPRTRSHLGGRRSARPPSHLHSDCPPDPPDDPNDSPSMGKRSVSLVSSLIMHTTPMFRLFVATDTTYRLFHSNTRAYMMIIKFYRRSCTSTENTNSLPVLCKIISCEL